MNFFKNILALLILAFTCSCSGPLPVKPMPKLDNLDFECMKNVKRSKSQVLLRAPIVYPEKARAKNQEGWVLLRYNIVDGKVSDIKIFDSSPKGIFEDSAIYSLKNATVSNAVKNATDCIVRSDFKLVD